MSIERGARLGRYRIEDEIGRGAMGQVYRALDEDLGRAVAIKVLPPHLTDTATFVDRFRREARTVAGLRHHGIVAIYDVGVEAGLHYLVMEFLAGRNLADIIEREGRLEPRRVLSLLRQIGVALDYAHERGVIHRDVKPANVIVSDEGRATLTDFGIAYAAASERITMSGGIIGTPAYMAPEQALGQPVDGRADLYSLAVMLYEMLSGRVPFEADSAPAMLLAQAYQEPIPIREHLPDVPASLERVLARALAKSPAERFPTGAALADAAEGALAPATASQTRVADLEPPQPAPTSATRPWIEPSPAAPAEARPISPTGSRIRPTRRLRAERRPSRRRWLLPIAAVAAAVWLFWPFSGGRPLGRLLGRPPVQPTPTFAGAALAPPTSASLVPTERTPASAVLPIGPNASPAPTRSSRPAPTAPPRVMAPTHDNGPSSKPPVAGPGGPQPTTPSAGPETATPTPPPPATNPPARTTEPAPPARPTEPPPIFVPRPTATPTPASPTRTPTPAPRPKPTGPASSPTPTPR